MHCGGNNRKSKIFKELDTDDDGILLKDELVMGFMSIGYPHQVAVEKVELIYDNVDVDGSGEIEIGEFCQLCATFLVEDPDMETMKRELKDAFRSARRISS